MRNNESYISSPIAAPRIIMLQPAQRRGHHRDPRREYRHDQHRDHCTPRLALPVPNLLFIHFVLEEQFFRGIRLIAEC